MPVGEKFDVETTFDELANLSTRRSESGAVTASVPTGPAELHVAVGGADIELGVVTGTAVVVVDDVGHVAAVEAGQS